MTPSPEDPLPTTAVPRWLAWIVLVALLAAAAISVHGILTAPPPATQAAAEREG